jgi:zinc-finger-containing domain
MTSDTTSEPPSESPEPRGTDGHQWTAYAPPVRRKPPKCGYCGRRSVLEWHARWGYRYACHPCDARVGCHRGTQVPLGTLADATLRAARGRAHEMFDALWQYKMKAERVTKSEARGAAYRWLAAHFGQKQVHIGSMDLSQCEHVVAVCRPYRERLGHRPLRPNRVRDGRDQRRDHDAE